MNKLFSDHAFSEYIGWQEEDKKTLRRINQLLKDIDRNGNEGIGNPEPLRYQLTGFWSRRINDSDRLIYRIEEDTIYIIGCKGHYR